MPLVLPCPLFPVRLQAVQGGQCHGALASPCCPAKDGTASGPCHTPGSLQLCSGTATTLLWFCRSSCDPNSHHPKCRYPSHPPLHGPGPTYPLSWRGVAGSRSLSTSKNSSTSSASLQPHRSSPQSHWPHCWQRADSQLACVEGQDRGSQRTDRSWQDLERTLRATLLLFLATSLSRKCRALLVKLSLCF